MSVILALLGIAIAIYPKPLLTLYVKLDNWLNEGEER